MERFPLLVQLFWVASPVVQFALAVVMIRRRLHREFPIFFLYCLFRAGTALSMFALYHIHFFIGHLYGYASLVHETGCIILRFGIIYELFARVFKPYAALRNTADAIFRWGTAALLVLAVIVAVRHHLGPFSTLLDTTLNIVDRTVDIIQCGLLITLLVSSRYLRLSWRNYAFGIAIGLGIFAATDLAVAAIILEAFRVPVARRAGLGDVLDVASMAVYLLCTLIWFAYALVPEPKLQVPEIVPECDLDAWNRELQRLLQR